MRPPGACTASPSAASAQYPGGHCLAVNVRRGQSLPQAGIPATVSLLSKSVVFPRGGIRRLSVLCASGRGSKENNNHCGSFSDEGENLVTPAGEQDSGWGRGGASEV